MYAKRRRVMLGDDSVPSEPVSKKSSHPSPNPEYSSTAMAMMAKMGHVSGLGLGKQQQGMISPLEPISKMYAPLL